MANTAGARASAGAGAADGGGVVSGLLAVVEWRLRHSRLMSFLRRGDGTNINRKVRWRWSGCTYGLSVLAQDERELIQV